METNPLILFGAGGHGKVVLDAALRLPIPVAVVVDDKPVTDQLLGIRVMASTTAEWLDLRQFRFLVAVGENDIRGRIFRKLESRGGLPINIIHPGATVARSARLGRGIAVCAGAVINPGALIGDNCIVNTSASIDHDCVVGDHVHLCPGVHLAGAVKVGNGTMIGTGAVVLPGIQIGKGCVVGAGAVVNRDLPEGVVAFGVPAKVQRRR
jgi:sugar O-acyltransferase (sialic acid O-acetyltransferase NeuD family)